MTTPGECAAQIAQQIHDEMSLWTRVKDRGDHRYTITLPLHDDMGDPIVLELLTDDDGTWQVLDDGGAVAGALFSNLQEDRRTRGQKLTESLAAAHRLRLNYDEGTLELHTDGTESLYTAAARLGRVVTTLITAVPHLRTRPRTTGNTTP